MKIKEIYISEAGLLSRMMPAGVQQFMANRRTKAGTNKLSDAAWQQWINRTAQLARSLGVSNAKDIPTETYVQYLTDFVENTMLRYDLDRYDQASKQRIQAVINQIAELRSSAGQVRKLFQDLGTQAVGSIEDPQKQTRFGAIRGLSAQQNDLAQAMIAANQASGAQTRGQQPQAAQTAEPQTGMDSNRFGSMITNLTGQNTASSAGSTTAQTQKAQPQAGAQQSGGWVDAGQGLYLKPATATSPTLASYRKNIFSLTDQGQWLTAQDKPAPQTWQAFLNQALQRL